MLRLLLRSNDSPWREWRLWLVARLGRLVHSSVMSTIRISTTGMHRLAPYIERQGPESPREGALLVLWHDHTWVPLQLLRGIGMGTLMSNSRDGQMQAALWQLYGWPTISGSSGKREAVAALREVRRWLENGGTFGFTPDGPKGPRHEAHPGAVYLASKSGCVIVPMGVAASRFWQLKSWDKFLVPKPFSHIHVHVGAPLRVPNELGREETASWSIRVRDAINEANRVARLEIANSRR